MKLLLVAIIALLLLALLRPGFGFRSQRPHHYEALAPSLTFAPI